VLTTNGDLVTKSWQINKKALKAALHHLVYEAADDAMKFIAIVFALLTLSTTAKAVTLSEYLEAGEAWKSGYVFGILESQVLLYDEHDEKRPAALMKCATENKINSDEAVRIVGRYILRQPDASTVPMVANVLRAFNEACAEYLK
jgi:hypothetical protein